MRRAKSSLSLLAPQRYFIDGVLVKSIAKNNDVDAFNRCASISRSLLR
jgi:hypothetical protein